MSPLYSAPPTAHMRRRGRALTGVCLCLSFAGLCLASAALAENLTLTEALTRARDYDPAQRASAARINAAEAGARQAGVKLNPSIGFDVENFAGSEPYGLADRAETTLYYQQTLERGGKRQARTDVARRDVVVAQAKQVVSQLDLFETVEKHWIEALAAQAEIDLAENRLAIALRDRDEVMRRVNAARDPLFAGTQLDAEVAEAQLNLDQAKGRALQAKQALAAFWGGTPDFDLDLTVFVLPDVPTLPTMPETSPDLALLEAERDRAAARIRVEQTRATQDVTLRGGVRYFSGDGAAALMLGGSLPLGRNDTNQGNIERAQSERVAAEADIDVRRLEQLRERSRIVSSLTLHIQEVRRIDSDVLPPARQTLELVRDGYARGGFRHTDVITAAENIAAIESRRAAVLKAVYLEIAELNRLDGRHADLVETTDTQP
jgi:outer membrane protein, heavy metal efflux system